MPLTKHEISVMYSTVPIMDVINSMFLKPLQQFYLFPTCVVILVTVGFARVVVIDYLSNIPINEHYYIVYL